MKRTRFNRIMALVLSLAVFVMFPFTLTQEAQAASTKTFYCASSSKTVYEYSDGGKETYSDTYYRDKNGLLKTIKYSGSKSSYTRNDKGYVTKIKEYNSKGKFVGESTYTYKYYTSGNGKGLPKTEKCYYRKAGKKTKKLQYSCTYTYYSNKKIKKEVRKFDDGTYTFNYRSDGTWKGYTYKGNDGSTNTITCDTHGNTKTAVYKSDNYSSTEKHEITYNKKTNPTKVTDKYTITIKSGDYTSTEKVTSTTTYTYYKQKYVKKSVTKTTHKPSDGDSYTTTSTYTATFKPYKVAKKYWHFYN